MIKFIIEVTTSKRDTNGNTYHYATVTKTDTGESISGIVDGPNNPKGQLAELDFSYDEIKSMQSVIPIRQWERLVKGATYMEKAKLEKFTGVTVWHLATKGINNWNALCNSKSINLFDVSYAKDKLDGSPNVNGATGVWCSDCRRANYYRKIA